MGKQIRPQFSRLKHDTSYTYLDNAATTLMPSCVIDVMFEFETIYRANVHRGLYPDAAFATEAYEHARGMVGVLMNATKEEIVFTSGTTFGLNMLAFLFGKNLKQGDSVVLTRAEHHANLVPWLEMSKQYGFELRFLELTSDYLLDESSLRLIDHTTKIVSVMHVSNTLGTIFPIEHIIEEAKKVNALTIIDAAQSVAHIPIDVKELDCDFLVASGHKMYGPTGIGFLYGKKERLENLPPFLFGGDMIREVGYTKASWNESPWKFEAGTPNIAGAIGLGEAVRFVYSDIGFDTITAHEKELTAYALSTLTSIPGISIIGPHTTSKRIGIISFAVDGIHPHDIADIFGTKDIAVRAGSHCTMPLLEMLGLSGGTVRMSFGVYTTKKDIDQAINALKKVITLFKS